MLIAGFPAGSLAANCYLVAPGAGAGCVIVDPGEDAFDQIVATVTEHGLQPVAALLTHGHLDHAASLRDVTRHFDIPGYLHAADDYMLDEPLAALSPELRAMLAGRPMPEMRPETLEYLVAGDELSFDGFTLVVDHTPGHTGGSVILRLPAADQRPEVLFSGDTLFAGSVGRTDLPGGSTAELTSSLKRCVLPRPGTAVVLPGHGPRSTVDAELRSNPFLIPLAAGRDAAATRE